MKQITTVKKVNQKTTKQANNRTINTLQAVSKNAENKASNKSTSYRPTQNAKTNVIDQQKNIKRQPVKQFITRPQSKNDVFKKIKIAQKDQVPYTNKINTQRRKTQKYQSVKNNQLQIQDNLNRMYLTLKQMLCGQEQMEKDLHPQQIVKFIKHILLEKQIFYLKLEKIMKDLIKKINVDAPQLYTIGDKYKTQYYLQELAKKLQQQIDQAITYRKKQKDDLQKKQRQQNQRLQKQTIHLEKKDKPYLISLIYDYRRSIGAFKKCKNTTQNSEFMRSYSSIKLPTTKLNTSRQNNQEQTFQYVKQKEQQISQLKKNLRQKDQYIEKLQMENTKLKNNPDIILKQQLQTQSQQLKKIRAQNSKTFIQNNQIKRQIKKYQYLQSKLTQKDGLQKYIENLKYKINIKEQMLHNLQKKVEQNQKIRQQYYKTLSQCQKIQNKIYQLKNRQRDLNQSISKLQKLKQKTQQELKYQDQHKNRMQESISRPNQQHNQYIHKLQNKQKQNP